MDVFLPDQTCKKHLWKAVSVPCPWCEIDRLRAENERLREALRSLGHREHYYCEDNFYSCPKSPEGCCDETQGTECNCGADEHNAKVEAALRGEG